MPKKRPIILKGGKISLVPPEEEDAHFFYQWLNDLEVSKGISTAQSLPLTMQTENDWFQKEILPRKDNKKVFSIIVNKSQKLIGNVSLMDIDTVNQSSELGIVIGNKKVWGKGYGSEATYLILKYGFSVINLNSVHLYVYGFNKNAIRAYEKVGFKKTGCFRKRQFMNGEFHDVFIMDMLRSEFNNEHK